VFVSACAGITGGSDTIFEMYGGLQCRSERATTQQSVLAGDAKGRATSAEAIEVGLARWKDTVGGEVTIFEPDDNPSGIPEGALVVDGNRVVVVFPVPAPAGGWIVRTTLWCEGYGP